jgi:HlyD family secretion protein
MDTHGSSVIVDEQVGPGVHTPPRPIPPASKPTPASEPPRRSGVWMILVGAGLLGAGGAAYYFWGENHKASEKEAGESHAASEHGSANTGAMPVEVAHPRKGGIERTTNQSGSVHAFEFADLYAKVSGYLKMQNVDIGDTVKRDQLLAEIDDPEVLKAVDQMKAMLDTSKAKVKIAEARIKSAEAEVKSSQALVTQSQVGVVTQEANVSLRTKQLARIEGLVQRQAIEEKLQDEEMDKFESAKASERYARAAVLSAQATETAKQADLDQAKADLEEAKANVEVAKANLDKAQVLAGYTRITSPYDGVVTKRTYHRGDFVRSAAEGGAIPLLSVARVDKMRVVLPVPDRDVPYVDRGDPAIVRLDALKGEEFKGVVARYASTEDPESRNMRTEVDLENPTGKLKEGMYGRVTIVLQPASPNGVTIPSAAMVGQDQKGVGSVYVVRDGKTHKVSVQVGSDNGVETEITSGLTPEDQVVTRYNGSIAEGTPVTAETPKVAKAGH